MIKLSIIAVGKLSQQWMRDGCAEYVKRMGRWCDLSVTEVEEHKLPENPSEAQIQAGLQKEGEAILAKIPKGAAVAAMCIEGKPFSSQDLAALIEKSAVHASGQLVFIIGGSFGLSDAVKNAASIRMSMSQMTFPHQLARVLLCEQLYRALSILNHAKYHK